MKKKISLKAQSLLFFLGVLSLINFGCQKDYEIQKTEEQSQVFSQNQVSEGDTSQMSNYTQVVEYRYDLNVVEPFEVNPDDTTAIILIESGIATNIENEFKMIINKFSTKEKYYQYGDSLGRHARVADQIIDRLAFLADSLNMDSITTELDSIPSWWVEIERDVANKILGEYSLRGVQPRGIMTQLNWSWNLHQCARNGPKRHIFTLPGVGMPNLWVLGWCDDPSGFYTLLIGGIDMAFDRTWYRRRMFYYWQWGFTGIDFCGELRWYEDRACSWWSFGI